MNLELLKQDYMEMVSGLLTDESLKRLNQCKFILNPTLGIGANTDFDNNVIEYGSQADEITIIHEMEHLRKGKILNQKEVNSTVSSQGKVSFSSPRKGIFLDESITEYMATELFKRSKYFEPEIDNKKLQERGFYKYNIDIFLKMSDVLGIEPIQLCQIVEDKHHNGYSDIDAMFKACTNDENSFSKLETALDYIGTAQYINYQCKLGNMKASGCSEDVIQNVEAMITYVDNFLQQVKNFRMSTIFEP